MTPEELLAAALHEIGDEFDVFPSETQYGWGPLTDAILATAAGQTLARQAAIGAAVERLQRYRWRFVLDWAPGAWLVTSSLPESKGIAPTLPAAIDAALGTKP